MSQNSIVLAVQTIQTDTLPTGSTVIERDAQGGAAVNDLTATSVSTVQYFGSFVAVSASYTYSTGTTIKANATSGNVVITMPAASGNAGLELLIIKSDNSSNTVSVSGATGVASVNSQWAVLRLRCDGSTYFTV